MQTVSGPACLRVSSIDHPCPHVLRSYFSKRGSALGLLSPLCGSTSGGAEVLSGQLRGAVCFHTYSISGCSGIVTLSSAWYVRLRLFMLKITNFVLGGSLTILLTCVYRNV